MIKVNKVIPATAQSGDGTALQPAAPLSPEVKAQLFDEFVARDPVAVPPANSQTIFSLVVLAAVLASVALYVIKQIKPDEVQDYSNRK
jgi:hypothetical protein